MKNILLSLTLLFSFFPSFSQSDFTERQLIENTIELYFEGWATGDTTKLSKAMHESCQLKNYREGEFFEYSKNKYLSFFKLHERIPNLETRIINIDITNNMGSAKVEISTSSRLFTDYFNLMKTSQGWKIADKVSTSKAHKTFDIGAINPEKEILYEGLKRPWSMAFLTEKEVLISEKEGDLVKLNLETKTKTVIQGFPKDMADSIGFIHAGDNTGKFEVLIDPSFESNKYIYLSYAAQSSLGTTTKVIRAKLENNTLSQIKVLFVADPFSRDRYHYGGGMAFDAEGKLYFTVGERLFNEKDEPSLPLAQNIEDKRGKIYRINTDGSIPEDNPDFGKNATPGLYAIGIRAAQGLALNPNTKAIWFSEHGTHQGDEINILKPGANYGWPIKTTGKYRYTEYAPKAIEGSVYTDPKWFWTHTVAPTGLLFYKGDEFKAWNGNLLVGGLSRGSLWRIVMEGEIIKSTEELFVNDRMRIRKILQSPMGKLYILTDEQNGKLIRIKNKAF